MANFPRIMPEIKFIFSTFFFTSFPLCYTLFLLSFYLLSPFLRFFPFTSIHSFLFLSFILFLFRIPSISSLPPKFYSHFCYIPSFLLLPTLLSTFVHCFLYFSFFLLALLFFSSSFLLDPFFFPSPPFSLTFSSSCASLFINSLNFLTLPKKTDPFLLNL